jgi:hypothetical protein
MTTAMKYNALRTLESLPAYEASLQVRLPSGRRVFLGAKALGLDVYFDPEPFFHYDVTGRFLKWSNVNRHLRRSFSHRVLETIKLPPENGGGLKRRVLSEQHADMLVNTAAQQMRALSHALQRGDIQTAKPSREEALRRIQPMVDCSARFNAAAARADAEKFFSIYRRVAILPPDQYNALVLQATEGCAHNECTFCGFYRGTRFHLKTPSEFRQHVEQAIQFHGASLANRRSIFLDQANALTMPMPRLLEIFRILNEHFEFPPPELADSATWWRGHLRRFDGVYSFLDAFTGLCKTVEDYGALRALHLRRVYLGMETGDDELLKLLNKPITTAAVAQTVRRLKAAGLSVAVVVLLGAGGEPFWTRHTARTIEMLNGLELEQHDYIYLSPLVEVHGAPYFTLARQAGIDILSPARVHEQEQAIREGLRFSDPLRRPHISRYDIEQFVY